MVDRVLSQTRTTLLDKPHQMRQPIAIEVALHSNRNGVAAAHCAARKRFLQLQRVQFALLVLHEVAPQLLLLVAQLLQHFDELQGADDGVGARNGGDDVAGHIFNLVETLLLDAEAVHAQVGGSGDEVHNFVIVLLEHHTSVHPFLFSQFGQALH